MNEDNDIIFEIADQFSKLKDYDYSIVFGTTKGKPKLTVTIDMSCLSQRFTHIVGLEHITDVEDFNIDEKLSSSMKDKKRSRTLNKILSKLITFQSLKQKSNMFFNASTNEYYSFDKTVNPTTGKPYTIINRLNAVKNIENIFNTLYRGKLFERNSLDILIGHSKIKAPFVITFPTSNKAERLYIFLENDHPNNISNTQNIPMRIVSAFSDTFGLIKRPINTYTVLKIDKIIHSNKTQSEVKNIFTKRRKNRPGICYKANRFCNGK